MILIEYLTLQNERHLVFYLQCDGNIFSGHTTGSSVHENPKIDSKTVHKSTSMLTKMGLINCLIKAILAAILDSTH